MLLPLAPITYPMRAVVAIKGNFLLGLNFLVISLYPIRVGATLMSSFLVNTALILAMSSAVIQFCASAFAAYATSTRIFDVFGNQVRPVMRAASACTRRAALTAHQRIVRARCCRRHIWSSW